MKVLEVSNKASNSIALAPQRQQNVVSMICKKNLSTLQLGVQNAGFLEHLGLLVLALFVIYEYKRQQYNRGTEPIRKSRVQTVENHLSHQGKGYREGQTDGDDKRRCKEHCKCPAKIRNQRATRIELDP
jgi:hypothetical protein